MSTLSYILPLAVLTTGCTTQVGGGDPFVEEMDERADLGTVDAGPQPDAVPAFSACGEANSEAHYVAPDGTCYEYFFEGSEKNGKRYNLS